jgi:hypothetical protein
VIRCVPVVIDGAVVGHAQTDGRPLTQLDIDALTTFHRILQEQHVTQPGPDPNRTHPSPAQPAEVDLAAVQGWVFVLRQAKAKRAELDEVEKKAREHIEALMGDAVDGYLDGKQVIRWHHTAAPRRFDKAAFAKVHPTLAAEFTKVGQPGRRFELVEPKDDVAGVQPA